MKDPGNNSCMWIFQWLASQPRSVLRAILDFSATQWDRLSDNWALATGISRDRECEKRALDATRELEHLRQVRDEYCDVVDGHELRQDVLSALACYTRSDELCERLELVLRAHRRTKGNCGGFD